MHGPKNKKEKDSIHFAVRTEYLNIIQGKLSMYNQERPWPKTNNRHAL